jgi:hypothetical protein
MFIVAAAAAALHAAPATTPAAGTTLTAVARRAVPQVRAICHAGDSLWVGTNVGVFVADIRDPSRRVLIPAGPQLPSNSVRARSQAAATVCGSQPTQAFSIFSNGKVRVLSGAQRASTRRTAPRRNVRELRSGIAARCSSRRAAAESA